MIGQLGKTDIKYSLKTSDRKEADRLIRHEAQKVQAKFDHARQLIASQEAIETNSDVLLELKAAQSLTHSAQSENQQLAQDIVQFMQDMPSLQTEHDILRHKIVQSLAAQTEGGHKHE